MHLFLPVVSLLFGAVSTAPWPVPFSTFSDVTVFVPPQNYTDPGVLYARTVELSHGVLLATWENYSPEPPLVYFPIYKSVDGGRTWKEISRVQDKVNNWGLRYQPFLYVLPVTVGKFPAGTVLISGSAIPTDLSLIKIEVYASLDQGKTWEFVSHVASGGAAIPNNGVPAIWEPFLMYFKGKIVLYYSDQRDPAYGQKLIHTTTKDLVNWSADVDDVVSARYTDRPGMTTVALLPNGKYIMTYEFGGGPTVTGTAYQFPVNYRINANPLDFNSSVSIPIYTNDKIQPFGSPYVVWSPTGGENGTIIVSSGTNSQIFVNQALGDASAWKSVPTPEGISYTRHLRVLKSNPNHLLIMGGGDLPPSTTNRITVSVIDIAESLKQAS
ncbi:hypothetical protein LZ554_003764 [Drepanopeziza brunnea f. sp. 'monogermtubi']|nr:hypothetical protein LZ554_003764 [Drepanopeziza brunnea f. sp. 'monogermtubi']